MTIRRGFTLVELAIAMAFVGVLSISIVLIISNTVSAYRRGLTLTRVNNVGSDIVNDMRRSIENSSARAISSICEASMFKVSDGDSTTEPLNDIEARVCKEENAYKYMYVSQKKEVEFENGDRKTIPIYGAFCTGDYSYVWNSGYFVQGNGLKNNQLGKNDWIKIQYTDGEDNLIRYNDFNYFRLIEVKDTSKSICVAMRIIDNNKRYSDELTNLIDLSKIDKGGMDSEPIVILPDDGGNGLALYDLFVPQPALSTSEDNLFYSVSFILGTTTGGADILANGNSCAVPEGLVSENQNYCAINKFNFAIQVNGG